MNRLNLFVVALLLVACADEAVESDPPYQPPPSDPPRTDGPVCDDEGSGQTADPVCEAWEEAENLCGVFLPPRVNETTWTDEQLDEVWTYGATSHMMALLRDEPMTDRLREEHTASSEAFEAWRSETLEVFTDVLRLDAASWPDTPLRIRELAVEQREGYAMHTIDYLVEPGQRIPAFLLVPDDASGPTPALVMWHGHGNLGKADMVGPHEDGSFNIYHEGADLLAREGYVVLAPDIRSFGETGSSAQHDHFVQQLLLHGRVALGTFVADAMKALDVLETYDFVDRDRIGMGGTSLGGEVTLFTAALDTRIKVSVVSGYLASYRGTTLGLLHCICQYVPTMGRTLDIADAAALVAPNPLRFVTGEYDPIFPPDEASDEFVRVQAAWDALDAGDEVDLIVHGGEHEWIHALALERFDSVLRP